MRTSSENVKFTAILAKKTEITDTTSRHQTLLLKKYDNIRELEELYLKEDLYNQAPLVQKTKWLASLFILLTAIVILDYGSLKPFID